MRTTVVFLFPYAIVDSTFAKISIMLPNPSNVAIPKAVKIIQKTTVEKTVFLLWITCFANIIFRTHPTMFSTDPEKAPKRKYCKMLDAGIKLRTLADPAQTILLKKQLSEDYYKEEE